MGRGRVTVVAPRGAKPHVEAMTDRPKRPRDANQLAELIIDLATGDRTEAKEPPRENGKAPTENEEAEDQAEPGLGR